MSVVFIPVRIQVDHIAGDLFLAEPFLQVLYFILAAVADLADPETVRPLGRKRRLSGQVCISADDVFHLRTMDQEVIDHRIFRRHGVGLVEMLTHVAVDGIGSMHEYTISGRAHEEGDILVSPDCVCAQAVRVPQVYVLPSFIEVGKFLSKAKKVLVIPILDLLGRIHLPCLRII